MDEKTREDAITLKIKLLREKSKNIERRHKLAEEDKRLAESKGNAIDVRQQISSRPSKNFGSHAHMDEPFGANNEQGYPNQSSRKPGGARGRYDDGEFDHGDSEQVEARERVPRYGQAGGYRQQGRGQRHDGRSRDYGEPRHQRYQDRDRGNERGDAGDGRRQRDERRSADYGDQDRRRGEYGGGRRQREDRQYGNYQNDSQNRVPHQDHRVLEREKQRRHNIEAMEAQMSGKLQKGDKDWQETGGFLKDPRREGEGEFAKHPPPRSVRYSPNENKGRQQYRNYGGQGRGDRTIEMTGRQRQDYDKWKQQQDEADKERLARSQAEGGRWRRDWDNEKKVEEYEEERKEKREYNRGGRRGGRFERGDRRQERDNFGSGDGPPRRQHDEERQDFRENRKSSRDDEYDRHPNSRVDFDRDNQHRDGPPSHKAGSNEWGDEAEDDWDANVTHTRHHESHSGPSRPRKSSSKDEWEQGVEKVVTQPQSWPNRNTSQNDDRRQPHEREKRPGSDRNRGTWGQRKDDEGHKNEDYDKRKEGFGRQQENRDHRKRDEHFQRREDQSQGKDGWEHQGGPNQRRDGYGQRRDDWGRNDGDRDNRKNRDQRKAPWNQKEDRIQSEGDWNQQRNQGYYGDQGQRRDGLHQRRNETDARSTIENRKKEHQGQRRDNRDRTRGYGRNQDRGNRNWDDKQENSGLSADANNLNQNPISTPNISTEKVAVSSTNDDWGNDAEGDWGTENESWGTENIPAAQVKEQPNEAERRADDHKLQDSTPLNDLPEAELPADETSPESKTPEVPNDDFISEELKANANLEASQAPDETSQSDESLEKQKNSRNHGNLKVRIDAKEPRSDSNRSDFQDSVKRSTSLTSPLKTPENFVPVNDWALEVEMSSPNYDQTKGSLPLEHSTKKNVPDESNPVEDTKTAHDEDTESQGEIESTQTDLVETHTEVESEAVTEQGLSKSDLDTLHDSTANKKDESSTKPASPDDSVSHEEVEVKTTQRESFDVSAEATNQTNVTPENAQAAAGFRDNFSDLNPADIKSVGVSEMSVETEQKGLLTGEDKKLDAVPEDDNSDKETYEDVPQDQPSSDRSDGDDDDSFATAGSDERDSFKYEKLEEESTDDELATPDLSPPADDVMIPKTPPSSGGANSSGVVSTIAPEKSWQDESSSPAKEVEPQPSDAVKDCTASSDEVPPETAVSEQVHEVPPEVAVSEEVHDVPPEAAVLEQVQKEASEIDEVSPSLNDEDDESNQVKELSDTESQTAGVEADLEEGAQPASSSFSLQEETEKAVSSEQESQNEVLSGNLEDDTSGKAVEIAQKDNYESAQDSAERNETDTSETCLESTAEIKADDACGIDKNFENTVLSDTDAEKRDDNEAITENPLPSQVNHDETDAAC